MRVVTADDAVLVALDEIRSALRDPAAGLVGFATGGTYRDLWRRLQAEVDAGRLPGERLRATHLDEYVGFGPGDRGGMVHELESHCPLLRARRAAGAFLPVPSDGRDASLRAHEERLRAAGGVQLQFLGIGRNGHLAFNEPGTPFASGFHVAELAASTRDDARARFAPQEPPTRACTAGLGTILQARRLVLCAFGAAKAPAVRAMLEGEVGPQCPATILRQHGDALVLLDREAASGLTAAAPPSVG